MCFSIPKKVKLIENNEAVVEGNLRVKLGNLKASPGDYVLVYGNMAVEKVTAEKAKRMRKIISNIDYQSL